jgi:hypothetical protein
MYNEKKDILILTATAHYYDEMRDRLEKGGFAAYHTWDDRQLLIPLKGRREPYGSIRLIICDATEDREAGKELYKELRREMDFIDTPFLVLKSKKDVPVWSDDIDDKNLYTSAVDLKKGRKSSDFSEIAREVKRILG